MPSGLLRSLATYSNADNFWLPKAGVAVCNMLSFGSPLVISACSLIFPNL
jgi:hypothetical protein